MTATLDQLKDKLPDYAKDTRNNIGSILTPEGSPGLTDTQIHGIALASAYATKDKETIRMMLGVTSNLDTAQRDAAKAAAAIMAMNNIYYRFLHLVNDADYGTMPAKLRMTVIGNPGVSAVDFELYSLAVSAINGCGYCVESHAKKVVKSGVSKEGVQSTARIASVVNAVAQVQAIES